MDGLTFYRRRLLPPMAPISELDDVGVADFNGDTKPDLIWRNSVTGQNAVWYMDGLTLSQGVMLPPLSRSQLADHGRGYFGRRRYQARPRLGAIACRQNAVWYMDGLTFLRGRAASFHDRSELDDCGRADFNGEYQEARPRLAQ